MRGSLASYDPDTHSLKTWQLSLDADWNACSVILPRSGTMQAGKLYPLPTWGRRTSASASGLWGTPLSVNRSRTPETMEKCLSFREKSGRRSVPLYLEEQVRMWPTPRSQTGGWPGASMEAVLRQVEKHGYNGRLEEAVALTMWPTPTVDGNYNKAGLSAKSGNGLATAVQVWPTPASRDYRHPNALPYSERGGGTSGEQLPNAVGGALNPNFVEWLLGLPKDWTKLD